MAWTAPRTWVAGETVDEDMMNEQVRDNGNYLKTEADKHNDCVMRDGSTVAYASPSGTRVKDTVYQNTGGKIRLVMIGMATNATGWAIAYYGSANPPNIPLGALKDNNADGRGVITFIVPPNYYYKITEQASLVTILDWIEGDIL